VAESLRHTSESERLRPNRPRKKRLQHVPNGKPTSETLQRPKQRQMKLSGSAYGTRFHRYGMACSWVHELRGCMVFGRACALWRMCCCRWARGHQQCEPCHSQVERDEINGKKECDRLKQAADEIYAVAPYKDRLNRALEDPVLCCALAALEKRLQGWCRQVYRRCARCSVHGLLTAGDTDRNNPTHRPSV